MKKVLLAATVLALSTAAASAQAIRAERTLSIGLALQIAQGALETCTQQGHRVSVTVVNPAGQILVVLRGDGAGPHTLDSSRMKAYTSATFRAPTQQFFTNIQANPATPNVTSFPGVVALGGGVPVRAGNDVIGAVGVGGAPGGQLDEACANAGIERVRAQLN